LTPGELAVGIRQVLANVRQHKQSAIDVARRAERWRVSHGYPGLANKLHNICRGLARTASRYERVFDGSSRRFRTEVGRLSGKAIVTSGVAGYLVYGLCLGLSIGRYRILLQGSYEIVPGASASCEVCTAGGSEILAKIELDHGTDSIVGDFEFDINSRCNDLEIRVLVNGIAQVRLEKVLIQSSVASSFVTHSVELSSHQV
jgi:hypothetical protein